MNISEKILAKNSAKSKVIPGELVFAEVDTILCHEVTTPPAIRMLEEKGITKICDADKIVVTPDHFVPNKDIKSAELVKRLREWSKKHGIKNYYELGNHGVCHAILPEQGHVVPGNIIVGADSHTCTHGALGAFATGIGSTDLAFALTEGKLWFKVPETILFKLNGKAQPGVSAKDIILHIIRKIDVDGALYMSMEFEGDYIDNLSIEGRMTICNMAIEAGGKAGLIAPDQKTIDYINAAREKSSSFSDSLEETGRCLQLDDFAEFKADNNAEYKEIIEIDISKLEPIVAFPHLPSNGKTFSEITEEIEITQAYLGSCTNGRIEDLRESADILKGKKIHPEVRMIVIPATTEIWKQAMREGLFDIFTDAGATISTPTCGACLGGHMGILASGERCISSTNRNFVGRMGSPESEVYLASPATVAASSVKGFIADPRNLG